MRRHPRDCNGVQGQAQYAQNDGQRFLFRWPAHGVKIINWKEQTLRLTICLFDRYFFPHTGGLALGTYGFSFMYW